MIVLDANDRFKVYELLFSLFEYVNKQYKINPKVKKLHAGKKANAQELFPIREKLWSDDKIIDDYLKENPSNFAAEDLEIVSGFKKRIQDNFAVVKHYKKYSIFMGGNPTRNYAVCSISNPISENLPFGDYICLIQAVLIPFKGKIIYDTFLVPFSVHIGPGMRRGLNEEFKDIKDKHGIIETL